jgi:uncharacterized protein YbjT (DUF2867 family)
MRGIMIVIATPTGQIGRQVLAGALARNAPVRVIARDPARIEPQARERVEIVHGSADDFDTVDAALAGADTVFWLVPPNPRAASLQEHVLDFVRPLCHAINKHGIARVVAVSSLGRGTARNAGQISAIFAMDDLVESTGVNYRSLCPPGFMENMLWQVGQLRARGTFSLPMSGGRKHPTCATRDIASVAVELLLDDSWSGQDSVPLLGPEDLSCDDQARIMSEVLGREIRFEPISAEAHKAALMEHGVSAGLAQGIVDMTAAVERGAYDAAPRTSRSVTPTTFRQWCEEVLRPAVLATPAAARS